MARSIEQIRKDFPYSEKCSELYGTIRKAINQRSFSSTQMSNNEVSILNKRIEELEQFYNKIKCNDVSIAEKSEKVIGIYDKYKDIDEIRIESESIQQRNKRIYIGIGVMLAGIGILLIINKKNK